MKILFIANPIEGLKPTGDSSLAMLREALRRGHEPYWVNDTEVEFRSGVVTVGASRAVDCASDGLPRVQAASPARLRDFGAVFIRKDPPFDTNYLKLCWLLSTEERRVPIHNRPSLLIRYHEKMIPWEAVSEGFLTLDDLIPTYIGPSSGVSGFIRDENADPVIAKPFFGFGGARIDLLPAVELLKRIAGMEDEMIQPFHEEVKQKGDRRVFFVDGEYVGDMVRMPKPGGFVSNLAQGGSALTVALDAAEKDVISRLGKFLKKAGFLFAGADLIGRYVSEVNVTSPTGIRSLMALEGRDISSLILDSAERYAPK